MKYIDLHCDALTQEGVVCVTKESLQRGDCLLQCFAAFVQGRENAWMRAKKLCDKFDLLCKRCDFHPVRRVEEIKRDKINAMLCIEGGEALEGDLENLSYFYGRGVRMLTLVWNEKNELGYPNLTASSAREGERGLTEFGKRTVKKMGEMGMLVDLSHASDCAFFEVAAWSKKTHIPFLVSHSGANACHAHCRNLTDEQIRTVAECGGVVGLYACDKFLSNDRSKEGQKNALVAHARHIVRVGGENALALGSDFDGTPPNAFLSSPQKMPLLLEGLIGEFGYATAEKIAQKNVLCLLQSVCK